MKPKITLACFLVLQIFFGRGYGQDIVWEKEFPMINPASVEEAFQAVNDINEDIALFLKTKQGVSGFLFDSSLDLKDSLTSINLPGKYKTLLGNSVKGDKDYYLYLTNGSKKKFGAIRFSFADRMFETRELDLKLRGETFVQVFNADNQSVLLTVSTNSSELNFYYLDGFELTRKSLDLGDKEFVSGMGYKTNLYGMLTTTEGLSRKVYIEKIGEDYPNAIESTSAKTKIYQNGDEVVITFDGYGEFTQMLSFNLFSLAYETKDFNKTFGDIGLFERERSNTFKFADKLFVFTTTTDRMRFAVNDIKTGDLIKEFIVKEEDSIYFKNTPIIQDGGVLNTHREMEKTKKFLRKTTSSKIGISVYRKGDYYHVTLGGKKSVASGGGMPMMGGNPVQMAGLGTVNTFYNPGHFAFYQYSRTKSTFIKCLFDTDFEHIEGEMERNVFDEMKAYEENNKTGKAETLFRHKDYFIRGEYNPKKKSYTLRRFSD